MGRWIKTRESGKFLKLSRSEYIDIYKEIIKVVQSLGGTPGLVASVNGQIGAVTIDKNSIGLSDVDNTSDLNKPISTATQTALDTKLDKIVGMDEFASDRQLQLTDNTKMLFMNSSSPIAIIVPLNATVAHPIGSQILFTQLGTGQLTITPEGGVTLLSPDNKLKTTTRYSTGGLIKINPNTWIVFGDLIV